MAKITVGRHLSSISDSVETTQGTTPWDVAEQNQLVPEQYDFIELTHNGSNQLTGVVYKTGGAAGTTVATLAITYDGSGNIDTVART